jgi:hypothetical protein
VGQCNISIRSLINQGSLDSRWLLKKENKIKYLAVQLVLASIHFIHRMMLHIFRANTYSFRHWGCTLQISALGFFDLPMNGCCRLINLIPWRIIRCTLHLYSVRDLEVNAIFKYSVVTNIFIMMTPKYPITFLVPRRQPIQEGIPLNKVHPKASKLRLRLQYIKLVQRTCELLFATIWLQLQWSWNESTEH